MSDSNFRSNFNINPQMYSPLNFKNQEYHEMPSVNSYNRYQHHIHDILSDKEQHSVQQHASAAVDEMPSYMDHHLSAASANHYDESLNLCKNPTATADYNSCMSPMPQNYSHAQDLCMTAAGGGTSGGYMTSTQQNSPPSLHPSFLNTSQLQHNNSAARDLSDHHRLLAPDKFVAASRLLVDPRFIEQHQHRLLGAGDIVGGNVKTVADQKSLGLSLYHQQLPTHQSSYHHEPVKATNMHANYHHLPFSAYYQ